MRWPPCMAMTSKAYKYIVSALVSISLLIFVFWMVDFDFSIFEKINPKTILLCALVYSVLFIIRSYILKLLSASATKEVKQRSWIGLVARHQAIFVIAPSGTGDFAFPFLAKRSIGLNLAAATSTILNVRIRDLAFLILLGLSGLVGIKILPNIFIFLILIGLVAIFWIDKFLAIFLKVFESLLLRFKSTQRLISTLQNAKQKSLINWMSLMKNSQIIN